MSEVGAYLSKTLGSPDSAHVIFVPGMGNGRSHSNSAWAIWKDLGLWYTSWTDFARGGQEFAVYQPQLPPKLHPCGLPILLDFKKERRRRLR